MKVIDTFRKDFITEQVEKIIEHNSTIVTDGSNSYNDLEDNYQHKSQVIPKKEKPSIF